MGSKKRELLWGVIPPSIRQLIIGGTISHYRNSVIKLNQDDHSKPILRIPLNQPTKKILQTHSKDPYDGRNPASPGMYKTM